MPTKKEGVSMSLKVRDLLKEALELQEDLYWQEIAEIREKGFRKKKALSHKDIWE